MSSGICLGRVGTGGPYGPRGEQAEGVSYPILLLPGGRHDGHLERDTLGFPDAVIVAGPGSSVASIAGSTHAQDLPSLPSMSSHWATMPG